MNARKVLSVLLATVMLLTCIPLGAIPVFAATSGTTGDCTWTLDENGHLTISGQGAMGDYDEYSNTAPWGEAVTSVTIEEGVTTVGKNAFYCCRQLSAVHLPDSLQTIKNGAFSVCETLSSVRIPRLVNRIDTGCFWACAALTEIVVDEENTTYSSHDGVLYNKNQTTLLICPDGKSGAYTIPQGVTSINRYAFNRSALTEVVMPNTVTSLGDGAFNDCDALTSVTLSDQLTEIPDMAFYHCQALTSISLPDSVTVVGMEAFYQCPALDTVTLNEGLTTIEWGAFYGCSALSQITIPDSVTTIEGAAFTGCESLTSLHIPKNVSLLGSKNQYEGIAARCYAMTDITVAEDNAYYSSEDGVLFNKDKTVLIQCPGGKTGTYRIPNGVTALADDSFQGCKQLTEIQIPDGITTLADYAFASCWSLNKITIPQSVTAIQDGAFSYCYVMQEVYYGGTEEERAALAVGSSNEDVLNATWYYNTCGLDEHVYVADCTAACTLCAWTREPVSEHVYDYSCDAACNLCAAERAVTHTYDDITDATCNVCGALREIRYIYLNEDTCVDIQIAGTTGNLVFVPEKDGIYCFASYGDEDTLGYLLATDGTVLMRNDDGGEGYNFSISLELTAHTPYMLCAQYWSDAVGQFTVRVTEMTSPFRYRIEEGEAVITGYIGIPPADLVVPDTVDGYTVGALEEGVFTDLDIATVTLPATVHTVYGWTFNGIAPHAFYVDSANPWFCAVDGVLYNKDKTQLIRYPIGKNGSTYRILEGVEDVWACAFYGSSLTSVYVPKSVKSIDDFAFYESETLTDVYYAGSEEDKADMYLALDWGNEVLFYATWHYNSVAVIVGDTTGDGKINVRDLGLLQQSLNGWDMDIDMSAADVTGDGKINVRDLGLLQQYLNGWDVELNSPQ